MTLRTSNTRCNNGHESCLACRLCQHELLWSLCGQGQHPQRTSLSCTKCKGKGFVPRHLCRGRSTIEWPPLFDPVVMKPCVARLVKGTRFRCLNCVGRGYA